MIIEPFDPATSEAVDRLRFELVVAELAETVPEDPTPTWEEYLDWRAGETSWHHRERFVAWDDARTRLLGRADARWETTDTNRHLGEFELYVTPEARRQGVGRALLRPVLDVLEREGRTLVSSGAWEDSTGEPFLAAVGLEPKLRERKSRCALRETDRAMLEDWVARAKERADRYTLHLWENECPPAFVERFVDVVMVMNTAPLEDFEMEDEVFTVEMFEESQRTGSARGRRWVSAAVEHLDSGEFAGFTQVGLDRFHPEIAHQWGTAVRPAHRDRGIGRWLKGAMALHLLDNEPQVAFIDTWNAGSNRPMLAINDAMGFRPCRFYGNWQAPLEAIRACFG